MIFINVYYFILLKLINNSYLQPPIIYLSARMYTTSCVHMPLDIVVYVPSEKKYTTDSPNTFLNNNSTNWLLSSVSLLKHSHSLINQCTCIISSWMGKFSHQSLSVLFGFSNQKPKFKFCFRRQTYNRARAAWGQVIIKLANTSNNTFSDGSLIYQHKQKRLTPW